jgi:hypothetical protein
MWELIEPFDEEGIYARFLAEKGEGIHPSAGRRVLGSLARRCPAKLAEHVSDGPRRTLPTRSTFRWMPLHPSRNTIEGTLMEGGSKWTRFCGTDVATTDETGTTVLSDRTITKPTRKEPQP